MHIVLLLQKCYKIGIVQYVRYCFPYSTQFSEGDPSPLEMWLENMFSDSVACLFILLTGSFAEQNFDEVQFIDFFFPFMGYTFGVKPKNSLPSP